MSGLATLERAFELARSGECRTTSDIKRRLLAEKHDGVEAHLAGSSIKRQLMMLCEEANNNRKLPRVDGMAKPSGGEVIAP